MIYKQISIIFPNFPAESLNHHYPQTPVKQKSNASSSARMIEHEPERRESIDPSRSGGSSRMSQRTDDEFNSTVTQGSDSGESGVAYYSPQHNSYKSAAPVYVPDELNVNEKCCIGVESQIVIPIVSVTEAWLHCTPTVVSATMNDVPVADPKSFVQFPRIVVTVRPQAKTGVTVSLIYFPLYIFNVSR
jgi:hypothetical protein